jgi:hypothetical protein
VFSARSATGKRIRLTETIWRKIQRDHPEFRNRGEYLEAIRRAIEDPDYVVPGRYGVQVALAWCAVAPNRPKHIAVVFRELDGEGFIITAFFISQFERLLARGITWQRKS